MNNSMEKWDGTSVVTGGLLVLFGALLLASNLEIIEGFRFSSYWPILLVLFGLYRLVERRGLGTGWYWLIVIGIWLQLSKLDSITFRLHQTWPFLVIALGLSLVIESVAKSRNPGIH